jgi:hypothetical protein
VVCVQFIYIEPRSDDNGGGCQSAVYAQRALAPSGTGTAIGAAALRTIAVSVKLWSHYASHRTAESYAMHAHTP